MLNAIMFLVGGACMALVLAPVLWAVAWDLREEFAAGRRDPLAICLGCGVTLFLFANLTFALLAAAAGAAALFWS